MSECKRAVCMFPRKFALLIFSVIKLTFRAAACFDEFSIDLSSRRLDNLNKYVP